MASPESVPTRRPLQPKNTNIPPSPSPTVAKQNDQTTPTTINIKSSNIASPIYTVEYMDASLAEELTAVRKKLERLRVERERTEKVLDERGRVLDLMMAEVVDRGEFQKQLEIEVDRLYRLKQLQLACMRRSPIRSLREKEIEKKIKEAQFESAKSGQSKVELADQCSATDSVSPRSSFEFPSVSTTASTTTSSSTSTSTKSPISTLRLSSEISVR